MSLDFGRFRHLQISFRYLPRARLQRHFTNSQSRAVARIPKTTPLQKILILDLKMSTSNASCALFFAVQLSVVQAKTLLLGLQNLLLHAYGQQKAEKQACWKVEAFLAHF